VPYFDRHAAEMDALPLEVEDAAAYDFSTLASLYVVDLSVVDADTGSPVNASLHFPENFLGGFVLSASGSQKLPGKAYGPVLTEQDPTSGRCRVIWIGTPDTDYHFRLTADGYQPLEIPPD